MTENNSVRGGRTVRVLLDSQSNPHFSGVVSEQDYDQRAALSQGEGNDIAVTTNPIDPLYISYWKGLGFEIPHLVVAGPFEKEKILSTLILKKNKVQEELLKKINGSPARLEFFTPSSNEEQLAKTLGIPAYVDFGFANEFQKKSSFKNLCKKINISTLPHVDISGGEKPSWNEIQNILGFSPHGYIAKHIFGTGGKGLGTIINLSEDIYSKLEGDYIIERVVEISTEIAVHWEIDFDSNVNFIGYFKQLAKDKAYIGSMFPAVIEDNLWNKIYSEYLILTKEIVKLNGLGFMCCDIIVDSEGNFYWSDLNPRKGAILFVFDAVRRLLRNYSLEKTPYFVVHEQIKCPRISSFGQLQEKIKEYLDFNNQGFLLVTNPGLVPHGSIDLTSISFVNHEHSMVLLEKVRKIMF